MSICGADVDSGANAEASEATGAWISVLGNLRISIWINGTAIIRPIAGLNGYNRGFTTFATELVNSSTNSFWVAGASLENPTMSINTIVALYTLKPLMNDPTECEQACPECQN